jgi:ribosomal protein L14
MQTIFFIIDNSGGRTGKCINIFKSKIIKPGVLVTISIQRYKNNTRVKHGQVYRAIVVQVKKTIFRNSGYSVSFNKNAIVLLKKLERSPIANRISKYLVHETKINGFSRVASLALGLI